MGQNSKGRTLHVLHDRKMRLNDFEFTFAETLKIQAILN